MPLETVLETERLRLTNWSSDHLEEVVRLHADPEVSRYLTLDGAPESRDMAAARLDRWAGEFAQHRMGKLRMTRKSDGVFLGRAGFGIYETGEPEIGYALLRNHWGHGYAFEAASGLRDWIFAETDHDHFIGLADTRNAASLRILAGIGMSPTYVRNDPNGLRCQFFIYQREARHG